MMIYFDNDQDCGHLLMNVEPLLVFGTLLFLISLFSLFYLFRRFREMISIEDNIVKKKWKHLTTTTARECVHTTHVRAIVRIVS